MTDLKTLEHSLVPRPFTRGWTTRAALGLLALATAVAVELPSRGNGSTGAGGSGWASATMFTGVAVATLEQANTSNGA